VLDLRVSRAHSRTSATAPRPARAWPAGSRLDTRLSVNAFVQYSSASGLGAANVRLRYSFGEGTDLWLVYNEGVNLDRASDPQSLRRPWTDNRSLTLKYTHTLVW